ncbi:hypothetical protein [Microbacterium hominis]|uniref:hypothetical protein n=1 Tax=Microbacterium hominis TaxID=162426 RepID=UPI0020B7792C|nr:hypothetical protein [Microbacterium hominis]
MRAIVQSTASAPSAREEIARLRAQLERVQGRRLDAPVLPVHPALASLLPGGGLRQGSAYSVAGSMSLLLALMAQPSQAGAWCGAVGMPQLGAEAAGALGVDLSRLVLVPEPGPRWLAVTATVAEVLRVVAVRPRGRAADGDVSRLAARLRDRGAVLLVDGPWPQAEAVLEIESSSWVGLGRGRGILEGREIAVTSSSRRWPRARRARVMLPDAHGEIAVAPALPFPEHEPVPVSVSVPGPTPIRAAG